MNKFKQEDIRNILIICLNGLGDVINTTPLIQSVKKTFTQSTLFFLLKNKFMENVCGGNFLINEYIHYDPRGKSLDENFQLIKSLRNKKLDLSLTATDTDFQKGPLLVFLSGVKKRVGEVEKKIYSRGFGFLYNHPVEKNYSQHRVQSNLDLFRKISSEEPIENTYFHIDLNQEREKIAFLKEKFGSIKQNYVCILPGCNIDESWRRWPIENYVCIAQKINRSHQMPVIFLGGPDEANLDTEIEKITSDNIINGINRFSIGMTASLIKSSHLVIGNDSGPMHIAGVFKVPTVSIFANVNPKRCAPWGSRNFIINSPSGQERFRIKQVDIDHVWESVEKAIQTKKYQKND
jgi:heptosyltransferase II